MNLKYIIFQYRKDLREMWYVAAKPGYMRTSEGKYKRDGSFKGGPEWTKRIDHAYKFDSRISAKRVSNKCPGSVIVPSV